jgi:hypothetical protein
VKSKLKPNRRKARNATKSFLETDEHFGGCEGMASRKHYCLSTPTTGGVRVVMRGQLTKCSSQKRFEAALLFGYFLLGKQKKVI